jgi:hypothetical protein
LLAWKLCGKCLVVSRLFVGGVVEINCGVVGVGVYRERRRGKKQ